MNAYEILGISPGASQEEIAKAYKKMALKYHPDRNRGREEWAKKKFIEVGEAYQSLTSSSSRPGVSRKKFQFSNKPGSDKFKEFEEMLREVREDLNNVENNLNESKENLNRERERVQNEAIRNMEENFSLVGVSSSDLDSSLWSPYSDWKEKVRNSIDSSLELFLSNMRIAISNAKWDKANNSGFKQEDNTQSDFSNKNFSPNNSGSIGEKKPFSTQGDEITRLKREIKYNKDYISKTPHEDEKEKCRKIVAKLEEKLRKLQQTTQSNSNSSSSDFEEINNDNKKETGNKKDNKDEKIKKLEDEIEQLKKSGEGRWNSWQKKADEKKIAEKEKELSELKKDNKKNNTDDELNEQLINELINEIERLRGESKNLKDEKDELAKKVNRLEKTVERLERETEELRKEIEELKESKDDSISDEHRTYMINRKNEELKNNQAMIEKLKGIINPRSESSPNPSSDSEFPTGWVVGGAVLLSVIGLVSFLIIRRNNKVKKILKSKAKIKIKEKGA